jgi:SAM-dependent methyltransferase
MVIPNLHRLFPMISKNGIAEFIDLPRMQENSAVICSLCEIVGLSIQNQTALQFLFRRRRSAESHSIFHKIGQLSATRSVHAFLNPPRSGAATAAGKPYHLDLAHSDAFDSLPAGSLVLEPGCGGGQMRSYLESKFFRYVGIDMSKTRVDEELQRHGGPDLICDAHFLPFMDQAFDVVYTSALTQHVACPYLLAQEIARVLKPGGYYFGNVSFLEPWHDDSFFHMSPLGVFETLTQAHFDIVHIWPGHGYSGFRAIMDMGNKATRPLRFLGDIMYCITISAGGFAIWQRAEE